MIKNLFFIFFTSIFSSNIALMNFLGMCPFIAISKDVKSAIGMGFAVTFVMTLTAVLNYLVYDLFLREGSLFLTMLGFPALDLTFLQLALFILVIAAAVQIVEIVVEKFTPALYNAMGIFLPLITVNCAILGAALFMILRNYNFLECFIYGFASGLGWMLAIVSMAGIKEKLRFSRVPAALEGPGITMIIAGLISFGIFGFVGFNF